MAISPDGRSAFIALASAGARDNAAPHQPDANRWLAIYKGDLTNGARTPWSQLRASTTTIPESPMEISIGRAM